MPVFSNSIVPITITIPGQPVAMGRPRLSRRGVYLPAKTKLALKHFRDYLFNIPNIPGMIKMEVVFVMQRPKYMKAKKYSKQRIFHDKRPDLDNLLKLVADGLQPKVLIDDAKIVMINASKVYAAEDEAPKTIIQLQQIQSI